MINVSVTYSDESQIERIKDIQGISLIDSRTKKGKKEAWALKSHWGAKEDPFVLVSKGDKPFKAFYSEAGDAIKELINYLNDASKN